MVVETLGTVDCGRCGPHNPSDSFLVFSLTFTRREPLFSEVTFPKRRGEQKNFVNRERDREVTFFIIFVFIFIFIFIFFLSGGGVFFFSNKFLWTDY